MSKFNARFTARVYVKITASNTPLSFCIGGKKTSKSRNDSAKLVVRTHCIKHNLFQ